MILVMYSFDSTLCFNFHALERCLEGYEYAVMFFNEEKTRTSLTSFGFLASEKPP